MIIVKIEICPYGDHTAAHQIGEIRIFNDQLGSEHISDYDVELMNSGSHWTRGGVWKRGFVEGFRRTLSPYHLVLLALQACLKEVPERVDR